MVAGIGFRQRRKLSGSLPVETAAVDQQAANGDPVTADPLGGRVHHQIRPQFDRPAKRRSQKGVVDCQREPVTLRDLRDSRQIHDLQTRVSNHFAENQPRFGPDRCLEGLGIARIDQGGFDAEAWRRMQKEVDRAAIQATRSDDMASLPHQGGHQQPEAGMTRGSGQTRHPLIQRRDPFLQHRNGGVADAAVDVAGTLEVEEAGRVIGVAEDVGRGLIDRYGPGAKGRVGLLAGMQGQRVELQELRIGHNVLPWQRLRFGRSV